PPGMPAGGRDADGLAGPSMSDIAAGDAPVHADTLHGEAAWTRAIAYASTERTGGTRLEAHRDDEAIAAHQHGLPTDSAPACIVDEAATLLAEGRHEEALQLYERAYELNPLDELRYNQAECLDALGLPCAAAACYEDWLAAAPQPPEVEKLRARIAELRV